MPGSVLPFGEFVQGFADEVAHADALMQLRQRQAWTEMIRSLPLSEGWSDLAVLGITVDLRFSLVPVEPRWWERLTRWLTRRPPGPALYALASTLPPPSGAIEVTVRAGREADGGFTVNWGAGAHRAALEAGHVRHPRA